MKNTDLLTVMNTAEVGARDSLPDFVIKESSEGIQQISLSTYAFETGEISIKGTIDDDMQDKFNKLLHIAARKKLDLKINFNSPGGSVSAGLSMIDAMKHYPYNIDMICTGLAASMAAIMLASGRKGHRFIQPHARMMLHEPLIAGGLGGSATSIQRTAESIMETKKILNELLCEYTGRTIEEIEKNTAYDNFFNAEEAVAFGLCDEIKDDLDYCDTNNDY